MYMYVHAACLQVSTSKDIVLWQVFLGLEPTLQMTLPRWIKLIFFQRVTAVVYAHMYKHIVYVA